MPTLKRVKSGKTVVLSFDQGLSSALNVSKSDTLDKETVILMRAAKIVRQNIFEHVSNISEQTLNFFEDQKEAIP